MLGEQFQESLGYVGIPTRCSLQLAPVEGQLLLTGCNRPRCEWNKIERMENGDANRNLFVKKYHVTLFFYRVVLDVLNVLCRRNPIEKMKEQRDASLSSMYSSRNVER